MALVGHGCPDHNQRPHERGEVAARVRNQWPCVREPARRQRIETDWRSSSRSYPGRSPEQPEELTSIGTVGIGEYAAKGHKCRYHADAAPRVHPSQLGHLRRKGGDIACPKKLSPTDNVCRSPSPSCIWFERSKR